MKFKLSILALILAIILVPIVLFRTKQIESVNESWTGFYYKDAIDGEKKTFGAVAARGPTVTFHVKDLEECEKRGFQVARTFSYDQVKTTDVLLCGHNCVTNPFTSGILCDSKDNHLYEINHGK